MNLEDKIKEQIADHDYDISIYAADEHGNVIAHNENQEYEAASCIKLFILVECYRQIYEGIIGRDTLLTYEKNMRTIGSGIIKSMDPGLQLSIKNLAILMIIISDNTATNMLIDFLGIKNINNTIKKIGLHKTVLHNRLEVDFDGYLPFGTTTPYEFYLVYKMIADEKLFSPEISREILSILKRQQGIQMLSYYFPSEEVACKGLPDNNLQYIASKNGSLWLSDLGYENVCHDGGIIATKNGKYFINIFTKGFNDITFASVIKDSAKISNMVYKEFHKYGSFKK